MKFALAPISLILTLVGCAAAPLAPTAAAGNNVSAVAAAPIALPPVVLREAARNISFLDAGGKRHLLEEYKGKFIVLAFFAHWCPICRHELPGLQQFATEYQGKNAAVVAVEATGADAKVVADFASHFTPNLALYNDPSGSAGKTYLVDHFPMLYLISPDFTVQESTLGSVPLDFIKGRYALYSQPLGTPPPG